MLFLEVGYTDAASDFKKEAKAFKEEFNKILKRAVEFGEGIIGENVLKSGELVTEYTLPSEKTTSTLTGATIDFEITKLEEQLIRYCKDTQMDIDCGLVNEVKKLNQWSLQLLECFIEFKEVTLKNVLNRRMFTINYTLLIEHIIREAKLYQKYVMNLEDDSTCSNDNLRDIELFWNQIMMEHALFIRWLLDPTEGDLINTANEFAGKYSKLIQEANQMTQKTMDTITDVTLRETIKYRDFKRSGAKGINDCEIRSLIVPLLADHVLREANHYVRILQEGSSEK